MFNVIVTGGSRGLGFAIATKLVDAGYQVIVIARHEAMQPAAKSIERSDKPKLLHFRSFDLRAVENIPLLVKNLRKEFGPIYALVNNAACGFSGILATMPDKDIRSMVELLSLIHI